LHIRVLFNQITFLYIEKASNERLRFTSMLTLKGKSILLFILYIFFFLFLYSYTVYVAVRSSFDTIVTNLKFCFFFLNRFIAARKKILFFFIISSVLGTSLRNGLFLKIVKVLLSRSAQYEFDRIIL
jgi:uncharacterized membrane protein